MEIWRGFFALLLLGLVAGVFPVLVNVEKVETDMDEAQSLFDELNALQWSEVFHYSGEKDWREKWFLDGKLATISNGPEGMSFAAGPVAWEDEHHAVLWTRRTFEGDLRIEYDYTRLDDAIRFVTILYVHATGKGTDGFDEDIMKWRDRRETPSMSHYFNHMNTYHVSYAAFGTRNEDPELDYIRTRRYLPNEGGGLQGTGLQPDYWRTGLFDTGVLHRIVVIKKGDSLLMRIEADGRQYFCHWDVSVFPPLNSGRIGLRHMYTRSATYRNFRVAELGDRE